MKRIGILAAALAAAPAFAEPALGPVLERLSSEGYGGFEVERERGRLTVEAVKDGVERELVYDVSTGALIGDTTRPTDDRGGAVATGRFADLYGTLDAAGYTDIQIEQSRGRIEVDAVKDGVEHDLTYDAQTGALVSSRVDDDGDDDRPGAPGGDRADDDDDDDRADRGRGRDDDDRDDDDDRGSSAGGDDRGGSAGRGGDRDDDDDDDDDDRGGSGGGSSGRGGDNDDDSDDDGDDD